MLQNPSTHPRLSICEDCALLRGMVAGLLKEWMPIGTGDLWSHHCGLGLLSFVRS